MGKEDFKAGSASKEEFFYWINERHQIYVNRFVENQPKPWTKDPILQNYKFTNVFRQLDRGTLALKNMLNKSPNLSDDLLVFNIHWYRLYNLDVHANILGTVKHPHVLFEYLRDCYNEDEQIFTAAHMTTASGRSEPKIDIYEEAVMDAWNDRSVIVEACKSRKMEVVFHTLKQFQCVGAFIAYEIVCDLRFTRLLCEAEDKLTWSNVGPGARRGLERLGLYPTVASMYSLFLEAPKYLERHVLDHYVGSVAEVPFELREIEHSLCEFDKYQRVKHGQGTPRQKFRGI